MTGAKPFAVSVRHVNGVATLDLYGDINSEADLPLDSAYSEAEALGSERVLLNFGQVEYINSTGIALIVGLLARARKQKRTLVICGLSDHYQEIFRITRLSDFMQIYSDERSALQS
jgi:anti-sigma B factor antagonist